MCHDRSQKDRLLQRKLGTTFVNFWTVLFFAANVYDFYNDNLLSRNEVLLAIAAIYTAFLAIYSAEKEFRRWHHMHNRCVPEKCAESCGRS